jgi:GNAT superfamily N-acetyltransferase
VTLSIRRARLSEREELEDLQRRSSLDGELYREVLQANPDAIDLPAQQIADGFVRVAELDGVMAGFSVLLEPQGDACELDGLFVEPAVMRRGIGRALIADAARRARRIGAERIEVDANPQAIAFYEAVGFVETGVANTQFGPAPRMSLSLE